MTLTKDTLFHIQFMSKYENCVKITISVSFSDFVRRRKFEYMMNRNIAICTGTQDKIVEIGWNVHDLPLGIEKSVPMKV